MRGISSATIIYPYLVSKMATNNKEGTPGEAERGFVDLHVDLQKPISDVYHKVDDYVDHEIEEAGKKSRAFRRRWVPVMKSTISSTADVFGDWIFFLRTKNGDAGLDEFEAPIYFFCLISSFLGGLSIISIILNNCSCFSKNENQYKKSCLRRINWIMGFEMFLEDIPQVVLTIMVLYAKAGGAWSPVAVFNVTTSAFNFTFNILDMLMPLDEIHHETKVE